MKKSRKFVSMPIVSLQEGMQIGVVRSLVVDPVKLEVAALIIDQRGWFREQKIIPYAKVKSVGADAITIDQSSNVQKPVSLPEILKLIKEKANPIGTRVIAENGTVIGNVDEYYIDEITGKITSLEIAGKLLESLFKGRARLPVEQVLTIGSDVVVVKDGAETHLEKIDGGLQETFSNIKEGTSSLLESTIQRTKEISKNIKEKYEKKEKGKTDPEPAGLPVEPDPELDKISAIEIKGADVLPEIVDEPIDAGSEPVKEPEAVAEDTPPAKDATDSVDVDSKAVDKKPDEEKTD